ncbi:PQQ-binding-like beta-propeller repeat protein [Promicromonospora sp. NPDC023987]|uniref:outer membrane protein assembly factor BamB family protein n=1 Tax=Promicromonospora sp. NPDC023987 TaxID=3155360 RepID=UPI0033F748D1
MARDPDEGDAFVFDLVDDDAAAGAASAGPAGPDGAGADGAGADGADADGTDATDGPGGTGPAEADPAASGSPGRRRRATAQVAAVLAVVLGTGLAVESMQDHARIERMRAIPGGVADVSSPLEETWAWHGAVGPGGGTTEVAVLGDVLAFESDGELVALDPATGEEAWTVELREDAECGPTAAPFRSDLVTSSLVCLQGKGAEREVIVVGPRGAASPPRALDATDTRRHGPPRVGPDGTVLRAERVGPLSAIDVTGARCTDGGECTGTVESGRDLVLRAEDAATGTERWTVTVPFRPADAMQCARTFGGSWSGSENRLVFSGALAPDAFGGWASPDRIDLNGCGIQAGVTPRGAVLGTELEPGTGNVTSLGAGRYAVSSFAGAVRASLHAPDGDVVGEVTGYPLAPLATDAVEPTTLLAVDEPGRRLRAYGPDGTPRWDITLQSSGQEFLAQVGDTAVVTTGAGSVRGLDLATGAEQWDWGGSRPAAGGDGGYFGTVYVAQAFTDGESVLLLIEGESGGAESLVALDAVSGAVVWERSGGGETDVFGPADGGPADGDPPGQDISGYLAAVDGYLLEVAPGGVRGLG